MSPSPSVPQVKITDVASFEILGKIDETVVTAGGLIVPAHAQPTSRQLSLLVVIGMRDAHRHVYPAWAFRLAVANTEKPDAGPTLDRFEEMMHNAIQKAKMEWALAMVDFDPRVDHVEVADEGETNDSS